MEYDKENNIDNDRNSSASQPMAPNHSRKSSSVESKKDKASTHTTKRFRSPSTQGSSNTKSVLNKDLCELFRVQTIRDMSSLSSITVNDLIQILSFHITELNSLKKELGFVSADGSFHLRLGFRNLLDRLLSLVKSKKNWVSASH
ncbi:unnamed protein product [Rotaria sp. Silwood2]|nr:unnamed protein product [Rotaria sp. Silwood2]